MHLRFLIVLLCLAASAAAAEETATDPSLKKEVDKYLQDAEPKADSNVLTARWTTKPTWQTADGDFTFFITGRLMWDTNWRSSSQYTSPVTDDSTYFRRARLGAGGTMYKNTHWRIEFDFSQGIVTLQTSVIGLKNLPVVGWFQMGHFDEPFSLNKMTSSRYITFMERAAPTEAFAPGKNDGLMVTNTALKDRMTWGVGVFKTTNDQGASEGSGGQAGTFRIVVRPVQDFDAQKLVHVGFGFTYRNAVDGMVQYKTRPDVGNGPRLVDTGMIAADSEIRLGFELAAVSGPFSAQAEFFYVDVQGGASPMFNGWYVFVSWFVTGESRPYGTQWASFGRVKPKRNFHDGSGGGGAWELAVRFDSIDLTDNGIDGGLQRDLTVGANWYWNPNTRIMFNFVYADVKGGPFGSGNLTIFETRVQFDF